MGQKLIDLDLYSIDTSKTLGEGAYGAVYPAVCTKTQEALAVKKIDTGRMRIEKIEKEVAYTNALDHPNIIKVKAHGSLDRHYFIFQEMAKGGELFDQVITRSWPMTRGSGVKVMPEVLAKGFMRQILAGLDHCHERGIAHRDLKLENVIMTDDGLVKIIDFGLSHQYPMVDGKPDRSKLLYDRCGSKSYAAPQVLDGQGYDAFEADMWAIGVTLFAMLSGFFPLDKATYTCPNYGKLIAAQAAGRPTTREVWSWYKREPSHMSKQVIKLLDHLLIIEPPHKRLTTKEALAHPWIISEPDSTVYRGGGLDDDDEDEEEDDDEVIYRGLGDGDEGIEALPLPGIGRQEAFSQDEVE